MKHIFIINPSTGINTLGMYVNQIINIFKEENGTCDTYELKYTTGSNDAVKIARKYSNDDNIRLYCIGGDGTLNEIINGIANTNTVVGVIPNGKGNNFFRLLSSSKEDIIKRTIYGDVELINKGIVNDRYFINVASIGFDAEAINNSIELKDNSYIPNNLVYPASIIQTFKKFKASFLDVNYQDEFQNNIKLEQFITLLAVCNGKYYCKGIPVAPNADYQDNLFDLCIADDLNRAQIMALQPFLVTGKQDIFNFFHVIRSSHVEVYDQHSLSPMICQADGELMRDDHYEFKVSPDKVKIIVPKKNH